jgi:hypothetical protein
MENREVSKDCTVILRLGRKVPILEQHFIGQLYIRNPKDKYIKEYRIVSCTWNLVFSTKYVPCTTSFHFLGNDLLYLFPYSLKKKR